MTTKSFLTSSLLTTGLLVLSQTSVFASTNANNSGGGYGSSNKTSVVKNDSTHVTQFNYSTINNIVTVSGNTGNNTSQGNGNSDIHTGDVNTNITITTVANQNSAMLTNCNCDNDEIAKTSSNGSNSQNSNSFESNHSTTVDQKNVADVTNKVAVDGNTGDSQSSNASNDKHEDKNGDWGMYSKNFWKKYKAESKHNDNWKKPHFWKDFCDQWMKDHGEDENGGSMNGGNTKIHTGDVNSDVSIHNTTNRNELSM